MNDLFLIYIIAWAVAFGSLGRYMGGQLKGAPTTGFWYGVLLGPLGLLLIFGLEDSRPKCPQCKMAIPDEAKRCGHCGATIAADLGQSVATTPSSRQQSVPGVVCWVSEKPDAEGFAALVKAEQNESTTFLFLTALSVQEHSKARDAIDRPWDYPKGAVTETFSSIDEARRAVRRFAAKVQATK